jgi:hypothetical protein
MIIERLMSQPASNQESILIASDDDSSNIITQTLLQHMKDKRRPSTSLKEDAFETTPTWRERSKQLRRMQKERWERIEKTKQEAEQKRIEELERLNRERGPEHNGERRIIKKDTPLYERPSYDPNWTYRQELRTHGLYRDDECPNLLSKCKCPKIHYAIKKRPEWPPSPPPFDRFGEPPFPEELTAEERDDILVANRTYYKGYMGYYRARYGPDAWRDHFRRAFPTSIPEEPISTEDYVTTPSESGESLPSSYDEEDPSGLCISVALQSTNSKCFISRS